jgi:hypothetical protein
VAYFSPISIAYILTHNYIHPTDTYSFPSGQYEGISFYKVFAEAAAFSASMFFEVYPAQGNVSDFATQKASYGQS